MNIEYIYIPSYLQPVFFLLVTTRLTLACVSTKEKEKSPTSGSCSSKWGSSHPTMTATTATKHFLLHMCRTLHSISFSSPLQCIRLRSFYLFIYLFASMWSKRLMKQQVVCHLCRNNDMEMVFTGHCVAPARPVLNWQQVTGSRGNRLSWMICFFLPSQERHQPGLALSTCG